MSQQSPLDAFKAILSGTARAMARDSEVEVAFTADAPHLAGKAIKVPSPSRTLPRDQVALARGFADASALKLRHHNAALHGRHAPADAMARAVYDAAEQARVEAIGARAMAGVHDNLAYALDLRLKSDPITRARNVDEVPLSTAVSLLVRERLTGDAPPEAARAGVELVREWIGRRGISRRSGLACRRRCRWHATRMLPVRADYGLYCAPISTSKLCGRGCRASRSRKLANRLQRRLMAQQNRSWEFDQEEGMLDAARLARIVIDPTIRCPTRSNATPSSAIPWSRC
jgi:cobalamin biosynthesis protein CobT